MSPKAWRAGEMEKRANELLDQVGFGQLSWSPSSRRARTSLTRLPAALNKMPMSSDDVSGSEPPYPLLVRGPKPFHM